ncbi:hypothetical protein CLF_100025 [Clonorchis sinensis]|uniref:Uncharacterized protein n=1 Tax=Clonorchis sinensis TaxID=79923 RepID=H2KNF1_CLOSI|nr:hypothetical protein CLF_100025 [Clonorchis sinensis]
MIGAKSLIVKLGPGRLVQIPRQDRVLRKVAAVFLNEMTIESGEGDKDLERFTSQFYRLSLKRHRFRCYAACDTTLTLNSSASYSSRLGVVKDIVLIFEDEFESQAPMNNLNTVRKFLLWWLAVSRNSRASERAIFEHTSYGPARNITGTTGYFFREVDEARVNNLTVIMRKSWNGNRMPVKCSASTVNSVFNRGRKNIMQKPLLHRSGGLGIQDESVGVVDKIVHLNRCISFDGFAGDQITYRIGKTGPTFVRLPQQWRQCDVNVSVKSGVCIAMVQSILPQLIRGMRKLSAFEHRFLQLIGQPFLQPQVIINITVRNAEKISIQKTRKKNDLVEKHSQANSDLATKYETDYQQTQPRWPLLFGLRDSTGYINVHNNYIGYRHLLKSSVSGTTESQPLSDKYTVFTVEDDGDEVHVVNHCGRIP